MVGGNTRKHYRELTQYNQTKKIKKKQKIN